MHTQWFFGKYIERLLEQRGGREFGWTKSKIARKTKLSHSYISWLVTGERTDKINPPAPSVDVILSLAKALDVHWHSLILAYQGVDPDLQGETEDLENLLARALQIVKKSKG